MANGGMFFGGRSGGGTYTIERIAWKDQLKAMLAFVLTLIFFRLWWVAMFVIACMFVGPETGGIIAVSVAIHRELGIYTGSVKRNKFIPYFIGIAVFLIFLAVFDYWPSLLRWSWIDHQMYWRLAEVQIRFVYVFVPISAVAMLIIIWSGLAKGAKFSSVLLVGVLIFALAFLSVALMLSESPLETLDFITHGFLGWPDTGWVAATATAVIMRAIVGVVVLGIVWVPAQILDWSLLMEAWLPQVRDSTKVAPASVESLPKAAGMGLQSARGQAKEQEQEEQEVVVAPALNIRGN